MAQCPGVIEKYNANMKMLDLSNKMHNKKLVSPPAGLGRLLFARSSLRFTAQQQNRYVKLKD